MLTPWIIMYNVQTKVINILLIRKQTSRLTAGRPVLTHRLTQNNSPLRLRSTHSRVIYGYHGNGTRAHRVSPFSKSLQLLPLQTQIFHHLRPISPSPAPFRSYRAHSPSKRGEKEKPSEKLGCRHDSPSSWRTNPRAAHRRPSGTGESPRSAACVPPAGQAEPPHLPPTRGHTPSAAASS